MLTEAPLKEKKSSTEKKLKKDRIQTLKAKVAKGNLAIQSSPSKTAQRIADKIIELDDRLPSENKA